MEATQTQDTQTKGTRREFAPWDLLAAIQRHAGMLDLLLDNPNYPPSNWILHELQMEVAARSGRAWRDVEAERSKVFTASEERLPRHWVDAEYEAMTNNFLTMLVQINGLAQTSWAGTADHWINPNMSIPSGTEYFYAAANLAAGLRPYIDAYDAAEAAEKAQETT